MEVVLPDAVDLAEFELVEDLKPYREWCGPRNPAQRARNRPTIHHHRLTAPGRPPDRRSVLRGGAAVTRCTCMTEPTGKRRLCRTAEECFQAGWDAAADHPPMTQAQRDRLAALLGPSFRARRDPAPQKRTGARAGLPVPDVSTEVSVALRPGL